MKKLNLNKILKIYLPSLFFIAVFIYYAVEPGIFYPVRYIIAGIFCLPLIVNLFLQNVIFSRIIGAATFFLSLYMILAIYSDVVNEKATLGYLITLLLVAICIAMSFLLMIGHKKEV